MLLSQIIKEVAKSGIDAEKPLAVMFGNVISESPLIIRLSDKMHITLDELIPTAKIRSLKNGTHLILLRLAGGQQFLILDYLEAYYDT